MAKERHKRIVFTGGGTIGHVTLNLLLMPLFIADGWEVHYIGSKKGAEKEAIDASGLEVIYHTISCGKLRRYLSINNFLDLFKVGWGFVQSLVTLARIRPRALFSKGGFVAVPPVVASGLLGVPVYVHESDKTMGLANKIAYRFSQKMYTTFEPESGYTKCQHIGAVTKVTKAIPPLATEISDIFDDTLPTLLFVGGSGGAKVFNNFISQHKAALTMWYNIINLTGDFSLEEKANHLYRRAYATDDYLSLIGAADVVVTRGGSNTLFELLAMQQLAIIVPLGRDASRGDQLENAAYFEEKGYAVMLEEEDLSVEVLQDTVANILKQEEQYHKNMRESRDVADLETFYAQLLADILYKEE